MAQGEIKHDYHLVDPSPWPVVGALGVFLMMIGAALWLNKTYAGFGVLAGIPWIFAIGLALVLYTMAGWWRDVITESVAEGAHAPVVKLGFRYGMLLFIVAEAMFFVTWFWAWFNFALFPHDAGLTGWPPPGIIPFDPWSLPLLGTVILLTSGTTVIWARHAIMVGDQRGTILALVVTLLLGIAFAGVEAFQLAHAPFGFNGVAGIYGSIFFLTSGILGLHIVVGMVFLAVCLTRAILGHFTPTRHFGFEAAVWYWHFVVVAWLFLFASLYIFGE